MNIISASLLQSANQFFSWWGAELLSLAPWIELQSNVDSKLTIKIKIGKDSFQVIKEDDQSLLHSGLTFTKNQVPELKALLEKEFSKSEKLSIRIELSDSVVLSRKVTLPANTEENLDEVIQYEMDRYTPFSADEVYFDYRLEERLPEKDLIRVLLIVIRKEILEPTIELLEGTNLALEKMDVLNQTNPDQSLHNVKLLRAFESKSNSNNLPIKRLSLIIAVLLLVTAITPLIFNHIHIYRLTQELKTLEPTVKEVKKLQTEYQKVLDQVGYLIKIKERNPSTVEIINILTKALPDHTYIQRLSLEGGLLSLQGLSASAAELIPIIDGIELFEDIRFAAPVTQNRSDNTERFSITARLTTYKDS